MTEKKIKQLFFWPISIIVSIVLLPLRIVSLAAWIVYTITKWVSYYVHGLMNDYNLFLLRHCDEAKLIKNPEARRILGLRV